ncbi:dihydrofolate reductase [Amnimonas aquatica]|uniref:dihydrofolate reductase n=1 Tax=Amnimonas aquatica TaxID=2094561 RepID=UPI0019D0FCE0|nr:dihydrofolate reductase [Amnimonas aquatica]
MSNADGAPPEALTGTDAEDYAALPDDTVRLALIVAMDRNRCIGIGNALPWRLPGDLQYFKRMTSGKAIIMGRTTYDSLGRPLPNRTNVVITRNPDWEGPIGTRVVHSLEAAVALAEAVAVVNAQDEALVIGGAEVYAQVLPLVSRMYITEVETSVDGDAFFPAFDPAGWQEVSRERHHDEASDLHYSFVVYDRPAG